MAHTIIGVIGASDATPELLKTAEDVGRGIAENGWALVTGGLGGVMEAASRGARRAGGTVIGILPQGTKDAANEFVTIPIATNMGHARNVIIAHTSDALIAVGGNLGTLSEIAVGRKLGKPVFAIKSWEVGDAVPVKSASEAIAKCKGCLDMSSRTK